MNEIGETTGRGRPSAETAASALELLLTEARRRRRFPRVGDLLAWREPPHVQALAVALDAAILAGEDGRMLTTNLIFDALAARWSETYHETNQKGPSRISWEMHPTVLAASLQDLRQQGLQLVQLEKLLGLVHHGCGLYRTDRSPERGYTVELTDETEKRRADFVAVVTRDLATGGHYRRRGSKKRLLLACDHDDELPVPDDSLADGDETDADTARKVVAGWAYNVGMPGPRSEEVIRRLEATRLFLDVTAFKRDYEEQYDKEGALVQARGVLLLAVTKSDRPREVPLNYRADAVLSRRQKTAGADAGPVFKSTWAGLRTAWEYALRRAKVTGFRPHDLRHTFASWAIQHGATLPEVKDLLSHATLQMTMRYAHLSPGHLRKAAASLDEVIAPASAPDAPASEPASQSTTGAQQPEATTTVS